MSAHFCQFPDFYQYERVHSVDEKLHCRLICRNEGLLMDVKARHAQEAKGLLVMIKYLKLRITREVSFRDDLASQKTYLTNTVAEKQAA